MYVLYCYSQESNVLTDRTDANLYELGFSLQSCKLGGF